MAVQQTIVIAQNFWSQFLIIPDLSDADRNHNWTTRSGKGFAHSMLFRF